MPSGVADDDTQLIVAEMDEKNLFPPPVEPDDLLDQVVDGIQDAQEGIPIEHDIEFEPESDSVIPSSKEALEFGCPPNLAIVCMGWGDE